MEEVIKIECSHGFIYEVKVEHFPHLGFSNAYYNNRIVGQVEYSKLLPCLSENDREHEEHDEMTENWCADAVTDLTPKCVQYFDNDRHKE